MSLLVICPPTLFRDGLVHLLRMRLPELMVVLAEQWSVNVAASVRAGPHLVLLDLDAAGGAAEDITAAVRRQFAGVPLIGLFDAPGDHSPVQACLRAGGTLCVMKSASAEVLLAAVQAARSSMVFLPGPLLRLPGGTLTGRHVGRSPLGGPLQPADRPPTMADLGLTPKQSRVLGLLLEGMSAKTIARELGLCTGTVKTHTTAVLRALNVNTRVQAVLAARRLGLHPDACH